MALAAADAAAYVHLGRGFGKGKKAGAEAHLGVAAENGAHKGCERAAQMGHADAFTHHESFNLMEHGGMGEVAVAPVDLAGGHHGQRGLAVQHGARLHRGRVGAHEHLVGDVQGVLHVTGRMLRRHVQGLEVVIVDLHFGAGHDLKAKALENLANLFHHQGGGMQGAAPGRTAGNGGVKALEGFGLAPGFQGLFAGVKQIVAALFDAVGRLAHGGALFRLQLGKLAHDLGDSALAAQKVHPQGFQPFQ